MLYSEFVERAQIEVPQEEYQFIEMAYYDFDGDKTEFCKWWRKAYNNGYWQREYQLRKESFDILFKSEERVTELEEKVEDCNDVIRALSDNIAELKKELDSKNKTLEMLSSNNDNYNKLMDALHTIKDLIA